ncbi:MAG: DNA-processing protein DprA [Solobacterium sp.]|nr:DNA-processing protein DprA [Solobacterium sp.]
MDKRKWLALLNEKYEGEYRKVYKAIIEKEEVEDKEIKEKYITLFDEAYPKEFCALKYPPFILYYAGDLSLLKKRKITIVGTREPSLYGKRMVKTIVEESDEELAIVSGLAKGIDAYAHMFSLDRKKTIGIIGNGLDRIYPKENKKLYERMKKEHLILSEYPSHVSAKKGHFPWRNRLLAALAEKVIVVEAKRKSGTMHTVEYALDLGKDIYCVPHHYGELVGEGCNKLIEEGAIPLYDLEQIRHL